MSRTKHILSYSIPIVILLFFLFGSFFAPHDPTATNIRGKYLSSSAEYPFGTDDFGRCEFSRILEGGKITLGIVLVGSAIAHRLKTVRNAQQIVVIANGGIAQRGTHQELMTQPGIYADFVNIREKAVNWKISSSKIQQ